MIDINDKTRIPTADELTEYVGIPLFGELCAYMKEEYKALFKIEYSGDNVLSGWNLKFKKNGRTLCTVYPRKGHFRLLLVIGNKEKQRTDELLASLSEEFCDIYTNTREGMGQRWLIFDFSCRTVLFDDVLKIVRLRRERK